MLRLLIRALIAGLAAAFLGLGVHHVFPGAAGLLLATAVFAVALTAGVIWASRA